jgi:acid stress chaperone HdeB
MDAPGSWAVLLLLLCFLAHDPEQLHVNAREDGMLLQAANAVLMAVMLLVTAGPASGQAVDLAKLKCREFIELPKDTIVTVTIWLDGYYTDEEDAAVFEADKLKVKAEKLAAFCAQNPKLGLMTAAESVMAK